ADGIVSTFADDKKVAIKIGYPVMVKASAGGGGRGIRLVSAEEELEKAFLTAKSEAMNCFGDDGVYIEKFIENPHHIEIQILADSF
ncbi:MAG: ATP-grasp domain-containing protein, partial [Proteobacteria bacterium]|nr:ATP-grasp domain-containing protein [Pseudomonadota bacterium]